MQTSHFRQYALAVMKRSLTVRGIACRQVNTLGITTRNAPAARLPAVRPVTRWPQRLSSTTCRAVNTLSDVPSCTQSAVAIADGKTRLESSAVLGKQDTYQQFYRTCKKLAPDQLKPSQNGTYAVLLTYIPHAYRFTDHMTSVKKDSFY